MAVRGKKVKDVKGRKIAINHQRRGEQLVQHLAVKGRDKGEKRGKMTGKKGNIVRGGGRQTVGYTGKLRTNRWYTLAVKKKRRGRVGP